MTESKKAAAKISDDSEATKFLFFQLGGTAYAAPLLQIREVIKHGVVRPVPQALPHFKGVLNLRGEVVCVVDLRAKFELGSSNDAGLILVVKAGENLVGLVVDEVVAVRALADDSIESSAPVATKISAKFLFGFARDGKDIVPVLDLCSGLLVDDFQQIASIKQAAA